MIRWDIIDPQFLSDVDLLAEYCVSEAGAGNLREDALAVEIERRHVDL